MKRSREMIKLPMMHTNQRVVEAQKKVQNQAQVQVQVLKKAGQTLKPKKLSKWN